MWQSKREALLHRDVALGCKHLHQVLNDQLPHTRLFRKLETISNGLSKLFGDWKGKMRKKQPGCALVKSASPAKSCAHMSAVPEQAAAELSCQRQPFQNHPQALENPEID